MKKENFSVSCGSLDYCFFVTDSINTFLQFLCFKFEPVLSIIYIKLIIVDLNLIQKDLFRRMFNTTLNGLNSSFFIIGVV